MKDQPTAIPHQLIWNVKNSLQCVSFCSIWMQNSCVAWQSITLAASSLQAKWLFIVSCLRGVQHFASCLADCSTSQKMHPCSIPSTEGIEEETHSRWFPPLSYCFCISLGVGRDEVLIWECAKAQGMRKTVRASRSWPTERNYIGMVRP